MICLGFVQDIINSRKMCREEIIYVHFAEINVDIHIYKTSCRAFPAEATLKPARTR